MIVSCPDCNSKGKLRDDLAGQEVRCPKCQSKFIANGSAATTVKKKWYYADGDSKVGPVEQSQFDSLAASGAIADDTLVWSKGMDSWQPFSQVMASGGPQECSECHKMFPPEAMMEHGEGRVCEKCKLTLLQQKRDGESHDEIETLGKLDYAGVGGRFVAKVIDMVFMLALALIVEGVSRKLFPEAYLSDAMNPVFAVTMVLNMLLGIFYITWFVGKFGATPGKMVFKLKIVNPLGGKIGYGQAFGRYCGEFIVVFLTAMLGYLAALFDSQKRTLHDRLCNTRVVKV